MVSKNQLKLISNLQQKKQRIAHQLFIAEGIKNVLELLDSPLELHHIYATEPDFNLIPSPHKTLVSEADLKKMSALATPNSCLAVFKIPKEKAPIDEGLIVVLDTVRDPGNLGTILRLCDWFGITQVVCSKETVDVYNPKVVQATMGSLARVSVSYLDLKTYLLQSTLAVYGTFMGGVDIYKTSLPDKGIIVLGNEANGISAEIEKIIQHKLTIPRFGDIQKTESLNVATATAIVLSEFRRQGF